MGGLPLAIELAAARAKVLSVDEIASRLRHRFRFLRSWSRIADPRHRTLQATIDWSYELLSAHAEPSEREGHAFLVVDRAGELEGAASHLLDIRVPSCVQGGLGEDEQRDRLDPAAARALRESHRLNG